MAQVPVLPFGVRQPQAILISVVLDRGQTCTPTLHFASREKVQNYWSEKGNAPREQRAAQGARLQQLEALLQPLKAAFEASKEALTTLGEDEARSFG